MINVIVGKPGTGKTYYLVKLARKFILSGRDVYSNFFINRKKLIEDYEQSRIYKLKKLFSERILKKPFLSEYGRIIFWVKLDDFLNIRGGEILIDECQIYFNSRKWKDLPERLQYKFQQHRKHIGHSKDGKIIELNIWGAVQNVKRIDTVVRELVNNVFAVNHIARLFMIREYDIEEIDKVKKDCYSTKFFVLNKKTAESYNTREEIDGFLKD